MKLIARNLLTLSTLWWFSSSSGVLAGTPAGTNEANLQEESLPEAILASSATEGIDMLMRGNDVEDEDPKRKRALRKPGKRGLKSAKGCKVKQAKSQKGDISDSLWDLITDRDDEFSIFIEAAEKTGFASTLMDDMINELTVFVPTDEAFARILPQIGKYFDLSTWTGGRLLEILEYHIVPDKVIWASELFIGKKLLDRDRVIDDDLVVGLDPDCMLPNLNGNTIQNPASFVEVDNVATNGILHVIDEVLTPSVLAVNAVQAAAFDPNFSMWLQLMQATGLLDPSSPLQAAGPLMFFGVPDELFHVFQLYADNLQLGVNVFDELLNDPDLGDIMNNHIIPDALLWDDASHSIQTGTYQSLAGESLVISNFLIDTVGGVPMETFFSVSNADLGVITGFLLPPGTAFSTINDAIVAAIIGLNG